MINEKISLRTWIEAAADQGVPLHTYLLKLSSEELELSEDAILEQMQTMLNCEYGGMNEAFAQVYALTGDKKFLDASRLGVFANVGDFTQGLKLTGSSFSKIDETYAMTRIKCSEIHYVANSMKLDFVNAKNQKMTITFNVSDNDIAFRYSFPITGTWYSIRIDREATSFNIPERSTSFVAPLSPAETGWCRV